jgi:hypothetical protein
MSASASFTEVDRASVREPAVSVTRPVEQMERDVRRASVCT